MTLNSLSDAWIWVARVLGVSLLLQAIELVGLRSIFSKKGIWRWESVSKDGGKIPKAIGIFLNLPQFWILVLFQVLAAAGLIVNLNPVFSVMAFCTALLICMRWRGTLNGGSDYMTLLVLLCLNVAELAGLESKTSEFALGYLAVQVTLSYFVAGCVKAALKSWWNGDALKQYLSCDVYAVPSIVKKLFQISGVAAFASICVFGLEMLFPLVWVFPNTVLVALGLALLFHFSNVFVLGLNRFFWAWFAAYPSLIYWVMR